MRQSKMFALFAFEAILFCVAFPSVSSAQPKRLATTAEQRMEGPVPIRLIAEAEEFTVVAPGWRVMPYRENYFASTFAITFLSRMACLSAPEQLPIGTHAIATQKITLPEDGAFTVMARYEQPQDYSAEFTVEVEQDGMVVYSNQFGALADPKIWALNLHKRVPMEHYWWGGTDNIVWQQIDSVKLHKGDATLKLIAAAQMDGDKPRVNAARRNVDVVCLTNDVNGMEAQKRSLHLEFDGWLTQTGDLFVKITNPQENDSPCAPKLGPCEQHSPYNSHIRDWSTTSVYRQGRVDPLIHYQNAGPHIGVTNHDLLAPVLDSLTIPAVTPTDVMLAPGETSAWIPMGKILDSLNYCIWAPYPNFKYQNGNNVGLDLQFAVPDGKGGLAIVRSVRVKDDLLYIPANVRTNPHIRTRLETLAALTDYLNKLPDRGPVPKRFPIFGILDYSGVKFDVTDVGQQANKLALALGSNSLVASPGSWAVKLGVKPARTQIIGQYSTAEALKKVTDDAVKAGTDGLVRVVSFADEVNIVPERPMHGLEEAFNKKFENYLKAQGAVDVPAGTTVTDDPKSPWYYYSQIYMLDLGMENFVKLTSSVNELFKGEVLTGANIAPLANFMVSETQFIRPLKKQAMSMGWSEDYTWQAPEFSDQITGYTVTALAAGAKYHNSPIMMYIMPHSPGNTPASFRRSFYTAIAHGTTLVNYFCATPLSVGGTENYIDTDDLPMWKAVHDTTHEAGQFEDYVLDGHVEKAKVAILLSSVDEIITGDNNMKGGIHNLERKGIYYALRHAQVPVDMLSEDDLLDGHADGYQVIYVTQEYLHSKAIKALTKFAENGGSVVGLCGGGMYDEYQRLNPDAEKLWGAAGPVIDKDTKLPMILAKQDLPRYTPLDTVRFSGGIDAPVVAWKQRLKPTGDDRKVPLDIVRIPAGLADVPVEVRNHTPIGVGKAGGSVWVVASFADGSPAAVKHRIGRGYAVLFGFLPATAYMKSALPVRPMDRASTDAGYDHFCPVDMDVNLRAALVDAFLPVGFERPVVVSQNSVEKAAPLVIGDPKADAVPNTQKSIVESTRIVTKDKDGKITRIAVPLVNFTGKPVAELNVALNDLAAPKSIKSVERGSVKFTARDGAVQLTLPLDVADMLLIDF